MTYDPNNVYHPSHPQNPHNVHAREQALKTAEWHQVTLAGMIGNPNPTGWGQADYRYKMGEQWGGRNSKHHSISNVENSTISNSKGYYKEKNYSSDSENLGEVTVVVGAFLAATLFLALTNPFGEVGESVFKPFNKSANPQSYTHMVATTHDPLYVRRTAQGEKIGVVQKGSCVKSLASARSGWMKVSYSQKNGAIGYGYVANRYLKPLSANLRCP